MQAAEAGSDQGQYLVSGSSLDSMRDQAVHGARLVVDSELVHDGRARLVQADNLDLGALAAELQHDGVHAPTPVRSQMCAAADVDATRSSASLKSKAAVNSSAEAKKTWPSTT